MSLPRLGQAWQGNGPPWNPLPNLPVWSWSLAVIDAFLEWATEVPSPDNQQVIEAFSPQPPQEPRADLVDLWSAVGRLQDFN
jgi:hypothetical protein